MRIETYLEATDSDSPMLFANTLIAQKLEHCNDEFSRALALSELDEIADHIKVFLSHCDVNVS